MVVLFRSRKRGRRSDRRGRAADLVCVDAQWIFGELTAHASNTGPADRTAAESAISGLYRLSQLRSPSIVWVDSPAAPEWVYHRKPDGSQIKDRLLGWHMTDGPDHGIDPGDPTYPALSGTNMWPLMLGTWVTPDVLARRMELWAVLLRSAGWWWPTATRCIVSEPPDEVHLETSDEGRLRLHCEPGPALRYRDSTAFHAWHGVIVPEKVIAGELTVHDWRNERNSERRRAMAERMGYAWLLDHSDAQRIAERPGSSLWRVPNRELDDDEQAAVCLLPTGYINEEDRPKDIMLVHDERGAESSVLRIDSVQEYFDTF